MSEQEELERLLHSSGADLVGFASAPSCFKEYTTTIVMAISTRSIFEEAKDDLPISLNRRMDFLGGIARQWLVEHGYGYTGTLFSQGQNAGAARISLRKLALSAGLGVVGKNRLVITEEFGPRVYFTAVLSTMPFAEEKRPLDFMPCDDCNACMEACLSGSLVGFEGEKCASCSRCVLVCPVGNGARDEESPLTLKGGRGFTPR